MNHILRIDAKVAADAHFAKDFIARNDGATVSQVGYALNTPRRIDPVSPMSALIKGRGERAVVKLMDAGFIKKEGWFCGATRYATA